MLATERVTTRLGDASKRIVRSVSRKHGCSIISMFLWRGQSNPKVIPYPLIWDRSWLKLLNVWALHAYGASSTTVISCLEISSCSENRNTGASLQNTNRRRLCDPKRIRGVICVTLLALVCAVKCAVAHIFSDAARNQLAHPHS